MKLYCHPISSYSQKVLMACYEKTCAFEPMLVNLLDEASMDAYRKIYPLGKLPFLQLEDGAWTVPESSIIIEYIDRHRPGGTQLLPDDPDLARQVRMRDRFFDLHLNENIGKLLSDRLRPEGKGDAYGVDLARQRLDRAYSALDRGMADHTWALRDTFSMADCAAAPALWFGKLLYPFDAYRNVCAYFERLTARPSFQRVLQHAEPYVAAFRKGGAAAVGRVVATAPLSP